MCGEAAVFLSMLVSFRPPFLVHFPSNPCLIRQFICFLLQSLELLFSNMWYYMWGEWVREGEVGFHGWSRYVIALEHKIILARNLMCQPEARCRVPVWLPVPQGTGESNSADHSWVWHSYRDCDEKIYPALHVQNGFVYFCCHELTQSCEYN